MEQENNSIFPETEESNSSKEAKNSSPEVAIKKEKQCPLRPSTMVNAILFIAIAVLYFLHFYPKGGAEQKTAISAANSKIAFFNTDTVFQNYELVTVLRDELKKEKERLEGVFNSKQAQFQQKVNNYQTNLKNNAITAVQVQNAEAQLMTERENLMKMNEEYTQQLASKEADVQRRITEDIIGYANKFNEKYGADYILGYAKGGPIIVTNPKMDVTKEILEGLNKAYNENKGK